MTHRPPHPIPIGQGVANLVIFAAIIFASAWSLHQMGDLFRFMRTKVRGVHDTRALYVAHVCLIVFVVYLAYCTWIAWLHV